MCAGPVYSVPEVFDDPQVRHRQMALDLEHPQAGTVTQAGIAIKLSETPGGVRSFRPPHRPAHRRRAGRPRLLGGRHRPPPRAAHRVDHPFPIGERRDSRDPRANDLARYRRGTSSRHSTSYDPASVVRNLPTTMRVMAYPGRSTVIRHSPLRIKLPPPRTIAQLLKGRIEVVRNHTAGDDRADHRAWPGRRAERISPSPLNVDRSTRTLDVDELSPVDRTRRDRRSPPAPPPCRARALALCRDSASRRPGYSGSVKPTNA